MFNFFILLVMREHVPKSLILIQSKNGFFTFSYKQSYRVQRYANNSLIKKNYAHLHLKMQTHALARTSRSIGKIIILKEFMCNNLSIEYIKIEIYCIDRDYYFYAQNFCES